MHATTEAVSPGAVATTVAIDLAKDVFELAFADASERIVARKRLKRGPVSSCVANCAPLRVVMEDCGSTHAWGPNTMAPASTPNTSAGANLASPDPLAIALHRGTASPFQPP